MKAYHWLRDDMTAGHGTEPVWTVGETRTIDGDLGLCERGYHASPTPWDGLPYALGSMLCEVTLTDITGRENSPGEKKLVGRSRTLVKAVNVERELRLFAIACAERALLRERKAGREPDPRSWAALDVARQYADGNATAAQLAAAAQAAARAAEAAERAARAAADAAQAAAARAAARRWQQRAFNRIVLKALIERGA